MRFFVPVSVRSVSDLETDSESEGVPVTVALHVKLSDSDRLYVSDKVIVSEGFVKVAVGCNDRV